ncbi:MAG: hypothetical protein COB78_00645 [Hyphomicrobiales bacterium]|nr:MAG: hypothetical protein COB78_00645 [Hyphomicrobiales bacterium]
MLQHEQFDIPKIAAMSFDKGKAIDAVLEEIICKLQARGYRVAGYLQRETAETDSCCSITDLESIAKGTKIRISQALGPGARGCRLDGNGLAEASSALIGELEEGIDLLILNRFGKGESEGQGFRAVIQKAMELNIPVLTAVRDAYRASWEEFGGEYAQIISHDNNGGLDWCLSSLTSAQAAE